MQKNVGKADRIIRLILGLVIITLGFIYETKWGLIGAAIMLPTFMGSDPIYSLVGINTNKA